MDYLSYVLEAKRDPEDYTSEVETEEETVSRQDEGTVVEDDPMGDDEPENSDELAQSEDYTTDSPTEDTDTEPTDDAGVDTANEDYTEGSPTEDDDTASTDNPTEEDTTDTTPEDTEDYTDGSPTDDEGGTSDGDTVEEPPEDESADNDSMEDKLKNVELHKSYIYIYNVTKQFMNKLDNVENAGFLATKIISRVNNNLITLRANVRDYIIYEFPYTSYTKNLYNYNHFLEAIRVNMIMLSKTGDYEK